jgi:hypothetical protein
MMDHLIWNEVVPQTKLSISCNDVVEIHNDNVRI